MEIISIPKSKSLRSTPEPNGSAREPQKLNPALGQPRIHLLGLTQHQSSLLERIASGARVLIIEGISGSGKDTLQAYLRQLLKGRDVYDYTEGEVLQSWNQLQIQGIFELQVRFMKLFVNYMRDVINRDQNAVFLLNRFHLSGYVLAILKQPQFAKDYDEILSVLKTLPTHVFILQLNEHEIEGRSLHPERSGAWKKFQQQIIETEGFRGRLDRYLWQQRLMLQAAEEQNLPHSLVRLSSTIEIREGSFATAKKPLSHARDIGPRSRQRKRVTQPL